MVSCFAEGLQIIRHCLRMLRFYCCLSAGASDYVAGC